MKKLLFSTLVSLLVAVGAKANTYTDNNPADVWLNGLLNPSYTGQFTLGLYNPAAETITSASATFTFVDSPFRDFGESFTVTMGGDNVSHGSFTGQLILQDT